MIISVSDAEVEPSSNSLSIEVTFKSEDVEGINYFIFTNTEPMISWISTCEIPVLKTNDPIVSS